MERLASIREFLDHGADLNVIRCDLADLIIHCLQRSKAVNNVGALDHLTNAVGTLKLHVNATRQPNVAGLALCMADIERAIDALDNPESAYQGIRKRAKAVTYDMLIEVVQRIRDKASCDVPNDEEAA